MAALLCDAEYIYNTVDDGLVREGAIDSAKLAITTMKILIGTDSRGIWPGLNTPDPGDWVNTFDKTTCGQHEITSVRAHYDHYLFSIFVLADMVRDKPDNYYDLTVIQSGWHEGVCFWPKDILENMAGSYFNEQFLTRKTESNGHTKYLYQDKESIASAFDLIKQKSNNVLCLGMHSLRTANDLDKEYRLEMQHHYDVLISNNEFSKHSDYFSLPMDVGWLSKTTLPDGIHYNGAGVDYLVKNLISYTNRIGQTINSIVSNNSNHTELYDKAKRAGSYISTITNPKDVVLLARKDANQLAEEFLGCILYGRIPLVIQIPSPKVVEDVFQERMQDILEQASPRICLCDNEFISQYEKYFHCHSEIKEEYKDICFPNPDDIAFYQLSSGTSGKTKLCKITHKAIVAHCQEYAKICNLTKNKCVVSWLPLYHDMGLIACFLMPLIVDCKFKLINTFDWLLNPKSLFESISNNKGTHIWMPNFAFKHLEQKIDLEDCQNISLESVEQFISCSEPSFSEDLNDFYTKFSSLGLKDNSIKICYALAENIFAVSQSDGISAFIVGANEYLTCGKVMPGVSVIIEKEGKDITHQGIGNVMIKSIYEPINNKHSFYGYYNTGDLGFMTDDQLVIIGRAKDSFVSKGINIYPQNIEQKVSRLEGVINGRAVCVGLEDRGTKKVGVAFESNNPTDDIKRTIMLMVKNMYDLSADVVAVNPQALIKTSSGKLCREKNKKFFS